MNFDLNVDNARFPFTYSCGAGLAIISSGSRFNSYNNKCVFKKFIRTLVTLSLIASSPKSKVYRLGSKVHIRNLGSSRVFMSNHMHLVKRSVKTVLSPLKNSKAGEQPNVSIQTRGFAAEVRTVDQNVLLHLKENQKTNPTPERAVQIKDLEDMHAEAGGYNNPHGSVGVDLVDDKARYGGNLTHNPPLGRDSLQIGPTSHIARYTKNYDFNKGPLYPLLTIAPTGSDEEKRIKIWFDQNPNKNS